MIVFTILKTDVINFDIYIINSKTYAIFCIESINGNNSIVF